MKFLKLLLLIPLLLLSLLVLLLMRLVLVLVLVLMLQLMRRILVLALVLVLVFMLDKSAATTAECCKLGMNSTALCACCFTAGKEPSLSSYWSRLAPTVHLPLHLHRVAAPGTHMNPLNTPFHVLPTLNMQRPEVNLAKVVWIIDWVSLAKGGWVRV